MELSAIFHHPDKRFCYALAPGQFLLRIQAKANDLRRVVLHTMDKYLPLSIADTRQQQVMEKVTTDGIHDYFEARISLDMVCLRYFFALTDRHGKTVYYGNYRFFPEEIAETATSLRLEKGERIVRAQLLADVMKRFEAAYARFLETRDLSGIRADYERLLLNKDRPVRVLDPKGEYEGTAAGINDNGELLVTRQDGSTECVYAGEVSVRGIYGYV